MNKMNKMNNDSNSYILCKHTVGNLLTTHKLFSQHLMMCMNVLLIILNLLNLMNF